MSNIDITKPVTGTPTTQSVRDNFAAAATEIDDLDSAIIDATNDIAQLTLQMGASDKVVIEGYELNVTSGDPRISLADGYDINQVFSYFIFHEPPGDSDASEYAIWRMPAGNYTLQIITVFGPQSGILEIIHEGIIIGTIDQYSPTTLYNQIHLFPFTKTVTQPASFVDYVSGFVFRTNSKNVLSASFYTSITRITVTRLYPP